jgi:hypothetical protein
MQISNSPKRRRDARLFHIACSTSLAHGAIVASQWFVLMTDECAKTNSTFDSVTLHGDLLTRER